MAKEESRKKPPDAADLRKYREKRNFRKTREPEGGIPRPSPAPIFVVQKHAARRLHYDLRLEADGVLKSWAVPKGPSYDPSDKRLAVHVEDHPLEYADFEGIIEENQYGAGTVMVWDRGTWTHEGDWRKELEGGKLTFELHGTKLKGAWKLIKIRERTGEEFEEAGHDNWLLIKAVDEESRRMSGLDVTERQTLSVKTGRSMEEITRQKNAFWRGPREASRPETPFQPPSPPLPKGVTAPWPESFFPQLATLVTRLPEHGPWISEIKFDGYRLLALVRNGTASLRTRRGEDWTEKFGVIARELSRLPVRNVVLDGEVVVLNPDGTTNFQKLQNILKHRDEGHLFYYVFDVPYYQDHDLSAVPLLERKTIARELLGTYRERLPSIRYSDHVEESGERVLRAACGHSAEGIVAKRADSGYVQKRTRSWLKKKCVNRQEFVVGGYSRPGGARRFFGSLALGYYNDAHRLVYCGNVGTGFNEKSIRTVFEQLKKLEQDSSPFASPVDDPRRREMQWVAPKLVAEVEFSEWTEGGHLRHPSFIGLREDKKAQEVGIEKETPPPEDQEPGPFETGLEKRSEKQSVIPIKLSNPEKVFYPEPGITKKELAEYYLRVGELMLHEAINRPLVLVRCPEGIAEDMRKNCFFQKHLRDDIPEWIGSVPIEEKGQTGLYPVVQGINGILSLVQLGVLEIHMLGCRVDDVEHPDRMVFDLDPSPEVPKGRLIEATFYIGDILKKNGMRPFLKLTGGKGIHVVVPLKPAVSWEELKTAARAIAMQLVRKKPEWFTASVAKKRRTGRILVDYLRNGLGASTIVPYSTRAKAEAPIALPVSESELSEDLLERPITVRTVTRILNQRKQNPWENIG